MQSRHFWPTGCVESIMNLTHRLYLSLSFSLSLSLSHTQREISTIYCSIFFLPLYYLSFNLCVHLQHFQSLEKFHLFFGMVNLINKQLSASLIVTKWEVGFKKIILRGGDLIQRQNSRSTPEQTCANTSSYDHYSKKTSHSPFTKPQILG